MKSVLITGSLGGIGSALVKSFSAANWNVIGADIKSSASDHLYVNLDYCVRSPDALSDFADRVRQRAVNAPLAAIINNAAVQRLGRLADLTHADIIQTMNINAVAPLLLTRCFLPELENMKGVVINIGSVHAEATKPAFAAYATSKAALHGATRAIAVDLGPDVRAVTLAPAATQTSMLEAGFKNNKKAFDALKSAHPLNRIATPDEIAEIAVFLTSEKAAFLTGSIVHADGGVLSRLHDPA